MERAHIERVLAAQGGNITKAAIALGIDRRTLQRKLEGVRHGGRRMSELRHRSCAERRVATRMLASFALLLVACGGRIDDGSDHAEPGRTVLALQLSEAPADPEVDMPRSEVRVVLIDPDGERREQSVGVFNGICQPATLERALVAVTCWWAGAGDPGACAKGRRHRRRHAGRLDEMVDGALPEETLATLEHPRATLRPLTGTARQAASTPTGSAARLSAGRACASGVDTDHRVRDASVASPACSERPPNLTPRARVDEGASAPASPPRDVSWRLRGTADDTNASSESIPSSDPSPSSTSQRRNRRTSSAIFPSIGSARKSATAHLTRSASAMSQLA
ncbi:MAG: helix-turn-helix domain-containing protein [Polyangiales bacterium]